uniref:Putative secreted protein n=1 Tax=Anopheles darlingi TaxID=43151 RepID=A0A2M4DAB2_ANODA
MTLLPACLSLRPSIWLGLTLASSSSEQLFRSGRHRRRPVLPIVAELMACKNEGSEQKGCCIVCVCVG